MKYIKMPIVTSTEQLRGLQCGQWIQLAWCPFPSRLHSVCVENDRVHHVTAFHYPNAGARLVSYCRGAKFSELRVRALRAQREIGRQLLKSAF